MRFESNAFEGTASTQSILETLKRLELTLDCVRSSQHLDLILSCRLEYLLDAFDWMCFHDDMFQGIIPLINGRLSPCPNMSRIIW